MPQYQGQFYTGKQATGDVLREILQGISRGRAQSAEQREQQRLQQQQEQARSDRLAERDYQRSRDAKGDARVAAQDTANAEGIELARALQISQLRQQGVMRGAAPQNVTSAIDLAGIGGVGSSMVQDPKRYTALTSNFYEDSARTPSALAANHQRLISRIAQRVAQGDQSAVGEAVANGLNPRELDPASRPGTPQYLAAQRAELELKDQFAARGDARQLAGQLQVQRAGQATASAQGKPPTEGELAGAGFLSRALEAHGQFDGLALPSTMSRVLGDKMVTGQTDAFRSWNAVRKNFATAVLRKESGASISPTEYESVDAMYIPLPGDSDELKATKAKNREGALRTLQIMSGRANGLAFQGSSPLLGDGQSMPGSAPRNPYR